MNEKYIMILQVSKFYENKSDIIIRYINFKFMYNETSINGRKGKTIFMVSE